MPMKSSRRISGAGLLGSGKAVDGSGSAMGFHTTLGGKTPAEVLSAGHEPSIEVRHRASLGDDVVVNVPYRVTKCSLTCRDVVCRGVRAQSYFVVVRLARCGGQAPCADATS